MDYKANIFHIKFSQNKKTLNPIFLVLFYTIHIVLYKEKTL